MKRHAPIPAQKETIPPQMRGLSPHTAVHNTHEPEMPANVSMETQLDHDFSRVAVQPSMPRYGQDKINASCPLLPQRCPFGGACHTCPPRVQTKLKIGQPGDKYEQEADRVAEQVMHTPNISIQTNSNQPQRRINVQKISAYDGGINASGKNIKLNQSGGKSLTPATRKFMEPRFSADFGHVRLHTDQDAHQTASQIKAKAFTYNNHMWLGRGESEKNGRLMAHELTHVLQQNGSVGMLQRYNTQSCDSENLPRIEASHQRALAILERAIERLRENPPTVNTQTLFGYHFGAYADWRRRVVLSHFLLDKWRLEGNDVTFECESDCSSAPSNTMYTYWVFGDIHVCIPWLRSESLTERGESFIHEIHHWDPLRGHFDLGYHRNNQDNNTTWPIAVNNADAYSELAQDLYEQP